MLCRDRCIHPAADVLSMLFLLDVTIIIEVSGTVLAGEIR